MPIRLLVVFMMLATAAALGMIAYRASLPVSIPQIPQMQSQPAPPPLTVGYLVAARALPAGTLARDSDFKVKMAPPDQVPPNALMSTPEVLGTLRGALVRHYLDLDAPVSTADVLRPRDRGFLAAVLAPGMRAISIGVDAVSGVAGLIWPGDRVDVILTQQMDEKTATLSKRVLSETILEDVRVIAVDQEIVQGAGDTAAVGGKVARTVTLQVTQDGAERLTVAESLGHVALAIRSMVDSGENVPDRAAVFGSDVSPALSAAEATPGHRVEVIQGDKHSDMIFR
jgi:pilus assembly protein CpaB